MTLSTIDTHRVKVLDDQSPAAVLLTFTGNSNIMIPNRLRPLPGMIN